MQTAQMVRTMSIWKLLAPLRPTSITTLGAPPSLAARGRRRRGRGSAEVLVARGIISASELLQQVAIELERFRCLTVERLEDFLGAEREFFDTHAHGVLDSVGNGCWRPET